MRSVLWELVSVGLLLAAVGTGVIGDPQDAVFLSGAFIGAGTMALVHEHRENRARALPTLPRDSVAQRTDGLEEVAYG